MHFEPADFASFTNRILKNAGIQKPVSTTAPFSMRSLNITGFEGQKFLNICLQYLTFLRIENLAYSLEIPVTLLCAADLEVRSPGKAFQSQLAVALHDNFDS